MKRNLRNLKEQKGITLIALVVTIVVLLILAAITVNLMFDNNGIIKKVEEAKRKHAIAEEKEIIATAIDSLMIDKYNQKITATEIGKEIQEMDKSREVYGQGDYVSFVESGRDYRIIYNDKSKIIDIILCDFIEKVDDSNPGQLEAEGNMLYINSIEDLVAFSDEVNSGNSFEGKTVCLGTSLDFYSRNSYALAESLQPNGLMDKMISDKGFTPIGNYMYITREVGTYNQTKYFPIKFEGTFDGKNNTIYNLFINQEYVYESSTENNIEKIEYYNQYNALFGVNKGVIKNLNIDSAKIMNEKGSGTSVIAWSNDGTIEDINIKNSSLHLSFYMNGCCKENVGLLKNVIVDENCKFCDGAYMTGICSTNTR